LCKLPHAFPTKARVHDDTLRIHSSAAWVCTKTPSDSLQFIYEVRVVRICIA
jgi:hypothetical protein